MERRQVNAERQNGILTIIIEESLMGNLRFCDKLKKWSLARCQPVNYMARLFVNDPNRVEVLTDCTEQLVIMRRDTLDCLLDEKIRESKLENFTERHLKIVELMLSLKKRDHIE